MLRLGFGSRDISGDAGTKENETMLTHFFRTLTVTVLFSLTAVLAYAQSDTPKMEVGVQFGLTRLRDLGETDTGMGIRLTYNLTNSIAAEGEFNYFPKDLTVPTVSGADLTYSKNRTQGLFGVKYTFLRGDKFGIGGKLRPGFMRFNGSGGAIDSDPTVLGQIAGGSTNFAMDIGGVFEYYPAKNFVVRFDLGDTIIRFKGLAIDNNGNLSNGFTSNNLQFNAGIGFRF
jgi:Outer membrane protein beta-barrel domain